MMLFGVGRTEKGGESYSFLRAHRCL